MTVGEPNILPAAADAGAVVAASAAPNGAAAAASGAAATPTLRRTLISLVVPAFNESAVLATNLGALCAYMATLADRYDYELIVVNDGSRDDTGAIAKQFAESRPNVTVVDHLTNFGLGQAIKAGFNCARGDVVVTLDVDLSYTPDHVLRMVERMEQTRAKIVIASPYLEGGSVENVPPLRLLLSRGANAFLSFAAHGRIKTLTGMVRAYDGVFLKSLDFYSMGMEVNSEILYKAIVLRARIEEIPARLRWHDLVPPTAGHSPAAPRRRSSMRIVKYLLTLLVSGFLYRPVMFFVIPGLVTLLLSLWCALWMAVDVIQFHGVAAAWHAAPYTFVTFGWSLLATVQLFALGLISTQNKCYFEQMFHLGTTNYRARREGQL